VLWGDEMGLGKTLQALATALYYQDEWPMLIICPSSLRLTWAAEIERWMGLDSDCVQVGWTSRDRGGGWRIHTSPAADMHRCIGTLTHPTAYDAGTFHQDMGP